MKRKQRSQAQGRQQQRPAGAPAPTGTPGSGPDAAPPASGAAEEETQPHAELVSLRTQLREERCRRMVAEEELGKMHLAQRESRLSKAIESAPSGDTLPRSRTASQGPLSVGKQSPMRRSASPHSGGALAQGRPSPTPRPGTVPEGQRPSPVATHSPLRGRLRPEEARRGRPSVPRRQAGSRARTAGIRLGSAAARRRTGPRLPPSLRPASSAGRGHAAYQLSSSMPALSDTPVQEESGT